MTIAGQRLAKGEDIIGVGRNPIQIAGGLPEDHRLVEAGDAGEVGSARRGGHVDVRGMRHLVAEDEHEARRAEAKTAASLHRSDVLPGKPPYSRSEALTRAHSALRVRYARRHTAK